MLCPHKFDNRVVAVRVVQHETLQKRTVLVHMGREAARAGDNKVFP